VLLNWQICIHELLDEQLMPISNIIVHSMKGRVLIQTCSLCLSCPGCLATPSCLLLAEFQCHALHEAAPSGFNVV
jgi:hypothetical protein